MQAVYRLQLRGTRHLVGVRIHTCPQPGGKSSKFARGQSSALLTSWPYHSNKLYFRGSRRGFKRKKKSSDISVRNFMFVFTSYSLLSMLVILENIMSFVPSWKYYFLIAYDYKHIFYGKKKKDSSLHCCRWTAKTWNQLQIRILNCSFKGQLYDLVRLNQQFSDIQCCQWAILWKCWVKWTLIFTVL